MADDKSDAKTAPSTKPVTPTQDASPEELQISQSERESKLERPDALNLTEGAVETPHKDVSSIASDESARAEQQSGAATAASEEDDPAGAFIPRF